MCIIWGGLAKSAGDDEIRQEKKKIRGIYVHTNTSCVLLTKINRHQ